MRDTQSHSVLAGRRPRWWAVIVVVLAFGVIGAVIVTGLLPASLVASKDSIGECASQGEQSTPYARVPGGTHDVAERVDVDGIPADVDAYPPDRSVRFVTISEPPQTLLSRLVSPDEPFILWMTECEKYGDATPEERRELSLQMMATSEDEAKYVALRSLGYDAEIVPIGVEIFRFLCLGEMNGECSDPPPAASTLEPGDVIRTAEGQEISSTADLTEALEGKEPDDTVELGIERDGERLTETVEVREHPDDPSRVVIGFEAYEPYRIDLPFEIEIETGAIGGPSAGLAFTLTLIDELSPGEMTGDVDVAVTGTIDVQGGVGAIGGLPQKAETARKAGVDVFLVPASQSEEELAATYEVAGDDLEIVPVATLDEAIAALEAHGGDPIELEPLPNEGQ